MPNNISLANVIEKNKLASDVAQVVAFEVHVSESPYLPPSEVLRFVRNNEPLTHMGNSYAAANFEVDLRVSAGGQPELNVTFMDLTREVQARMQEFSGGVGFPVILSVINGSLPNEPPALKEYFEIITSSSKDYVVTFSLGADNGVGAVFPGRRQRRDLCGWRYKDATTCGYTGELPSCDQTRDGANGCKVHGNANRFGGFPGISGDASFYG